MSRAVTDAIALQRELAGRLMLAGSLDDVDLVAGADTSSRLGSPWIVGAVAVWSISLEEVVQTAAAVRPADFPYIPGLLAFREMPVLLEAFREVDHIDAVICDGQGIAHPRGMGIACHLGLELGIPAVGCAKSRLVGTFDAPNIECGASSPLYYHGSVVGSVLRTRARAKPVFVSPGHLCSLDAAARLTLRCCLRYKLPEPIRAAHRICSERMKELV